LEEKPGGELDLWCGVILPDKAIILAVGCSGGREFVYPTGGEMIVLHLKVVV
jgi:hypothetical protein